MLVASRLRLVLNAEGYDYLDDMLTAGLHLFFHGPGEHPPLIRYDSRNIVLSAGTHNYISVRVCFLLLPNNIFITGRIYSQTIFGFFSQFSKLSLGGATTDVRNGGKNENLRKWVQSLCAPLRPFIREVKEKYYHNILPHVL